METTETTRCNHCHCMTVNQVTEAGYPEEFCSPECKQAAEDEFYDQQARSEYDQ